MRKNVFGAGLRVFDNFQFIRNNIGGGDGLELSTHFRSFSIEREREMEGKQRRRGEEERKKGNNSTSSAYFLYRWIIRAWPRVYGEAFTKEIASIVARW